MTIARSLSGSALIAVALIAGAPLHDIGFGSQIASAQTATPPAGTKFAYVRGQDILAQTPGRPELEAQFNKEVDSAKALEKVWGDSMNTMVSDYAKKEPTMTADQKTAQQAALREKQASYQQRTQQLEQKVQADNQRLVSPVLQRVNQIIDQMRTEGGYTMIFDVQNQGSGIVSADKNLDITDQVITRLKAMGPVPIPAAGTATSATPGVTPRTGPTSTPSGLGRPKNPQ